MASLGRGKEVKSSGGDRTAGAEFQRYRESSKVTGRVPNDEKSSKDESSNKRRRVELANSYKQLFELGGLFMV